MSLETFLFQYANHLAILLTLVAIGIASTIVMPLFRKPLDVKGKVCYFQSAPVMDRLFAIDNHDNMGKGNGLMIALLYYWWICWTWESTCGTTSETRGTSHYSSQRSNSIETSRGWIESESNVQAFHSSDPRRTDVKSIARPGQIIQAIPADLTQSTTSTEALDKSAQAHGGRTPDHVYLCAGFSKPKFMIDSTEEEFKGVSPLLEI